MLMSWAHAAPDDAVRKEVLHLLDFLGNSGCSFYRNGKWHDARAARKHLQRKYDYLDKRNLIQRTEDFVELAATRSSRSGKAYRVRCPQQAEVAGGAWLAEELARYRTGPAGVRE